MESKEKIPIQQVIDDMYNPDGGLVSLAARAYYYNTYATPEEQKEMDREDKVQIILSLIFVIVLVTCVVVLAFWR